MRTLILTFLVLLPLPASATQYSWTLTDATFFGKFYEFQWNYVEHPSETNMHGVSTGNGKVTYDDVTGKIAFSQAFDFSLEDPPELLPQDMSFVLTDGVFSGTADLPANHGPTSDMFFDPLTGDMRTEFYYSQVDFSTGDTMTLDAHDFNSIPGNAPNNSPIEIFNNAALFDFYDFGFHEFSDAHVHATATYNGDPAPVPEPSTLLLLGLSSLGWYRRSKRGQLEG